MTEEDIQAWFDKYDPNFGRTKPQCLPISIPSAWNRGKARYFLYYLNCCGWGRWFDKLDEYLTFRETSDKDHIQETHVYEIER